MIARLITFLKPIFTLVLLIVILQYTGLLSSISVLTNSALLSTGIMNIDPEKNTTGQKTFNYDFLLKDLAGKQLDVNSLRGKVIFLNLWATWCGPCRAEMPSIQKLYNKVDRDKVVFIMLSMDEEGNQQKVSKYITNKAYTFPVYIPASALPAQLQVPSIPTTFVVGADGKVEMKKVGTANYNTEKFVNFIDKLSTAAN